MAEQLRLAAMEQRLICYPSSILVDGKTVPHVMLAPPLIAREEDLEEGISRLARSIDQVLA
jgi:adenosylmethionine-8-amino-7-oxononanoate aminotransferase